MAVTVHLLEAANLADGPTNRNNLDVTDLADELNSALHGGDFTAVLISSQLQIHHRSFVNIANAAVERDGAPSTRPAIHV